MTTFRIIELFEIRAGLQGIPADAPSGTIVVIDHVPEGGVDAFVGTEFSVVFGDGRKKPCTVALAKDHLKAVSFLVEGTTGTDFENAVAVEF